MMAGALPDSPLARIDPNTATSPWTGVGSVVVSGGSFSGVVVAPRFVLTASHVTAGAPPSAIQFVLNIGGNQTHTIAAQSVTYYPNANFPYDDLALIELATPLPGGVTIYPLARTALTIGQRIKLVGYGASGYGDVGSSVGGASSVRRTGDNIVDIIQTTLDSSGRTGLFYIYDFDGPSGAGSMGGATLGNAVETIVASGDSGGPAFIGTPGNYRLAGINTFLTTLNGQPLDSRFGSIGGGVVLSKPEYLQWIDATTGYTTPGNEYADAPTLPEWAVLLGICLLGGMMWRRGHAPVA